jgi:hypothetical protein
MKMSQMRKKSFSFEEEELAWINPLLVEWAKENEGKNQSDLVLQLLKDYRDRPPTIKETLDDATSNMKEKLSDYSSKSKEALDGFMGKSKDGLQDVQSKMKKESEGFMDRLRKAEADVRTKLEDIKAERSKPKEDPEEE